MKGSAYQVLTFPFYDPSENPPTFFYLVNFLQWYTIHGYHCFLVKGICLSHYFLQMLSASFLPLDEGERAWKKYSCDVQNKFWYGKFLNLSFWQLRYICIYVGDKNGDSRLNRWGGCDLQIWQHLVESDKSLISLLGFMLMILSIPEIIIQMELRPLFPPWQLKEDICRWKTW